MWRWLNSRLILFEQVIIYFIYALSIPAFMLRKAKTNKFAIKDVRD
jgi:hypothetical protein